MKRTPKGNLYEAGIQAQVCNTPGLASCEKTEPETWRVTATPVFYSLGRAT